ncbi:MAG: HNH endonuclease [Burkholderiales bacterium]|nr:HNH endonuclease [Burkholderiales bacterium]
MAARRAFQRLHPCPATGKPRGACPGYVVDHIVPLCAGGADDPINMQWQERAESHAKGAQEGRQCRALRDQSRRAYSSDTE